MNCPNHPERPASQCCTVCAGYFCLDCAPAHRFLGEPVCPGCTPELTRQLMTAGSSPSAERRRVAPRAGLLFFGAALLALASVLVSEVVLPSLRAGVDEGDREAQLVASFEQVGAALERYHTEHGSYPATLEALVPGQLSSLPSDPWGSPGATLLYRAADDELGPVVLYSVGPDGLDNGGIGLSLATGRGDRIYPVR